MKALYLIFAILLVLAPLALVAEGECCLTLYGNISNGYVNIPGDASLDLGNTYTIEAWIKPASFNYLAGIVSQYTTGTGFTLRLLGTGNCRGINFDEMTTEDDILDADTWYHIAAVNNNGTHSLYINGVATYIYGSPITPVNAQRPITIGRDWHVDNERCFNGLIDEVRIWSTARTQAQITAKMNVELHGTETGLVAYFPFNAYGVLPITSVGPTTYYGTRVGSFNWVIPGIVTMAGAGTVSDPFLLYNKYEMKIISDNTSYWNDYISQEDDITFTTSDFEEGAYFYNSGNKWSPIGNATTPFTGHFEGNDYDINSLRLNYSTSNYTGLFGYLSNATISNVNVLNCNAYGYDYLGALAGAATGANVITNVHTSGLLIATASGIQNAQGVGGVIGALYGTGSVLSDLYFYGTIRGHARVGGLIGTIKGQAMSITGGYAGGEILFATDADARYMGGITSVVESADGSTMTNPVVIEKVHSYLTISGNRSSGNTGDVGGLVGVLNNGAILRNCYAFGTVKGPTTGTATTRGTGGLIGRIPGSTCQVVNCYSNCAVTGSTSANCVGGFIGSSSATTSGCFWNTDTSGQSTSAGGATGLDDTSFKNHDAFLAAGWVFPDIWHLDESVTDPDNSGYPTLAWQGLNDLYLPEAAHIVFPMDYEGCLPRLVTVNWRWSSGDYPDGFRVYQNGTQVGADIPWDGDVLYSLRLNQAAWGDSVAWKVAPYTSAGECPESAYYTYFVMDEPSGGEDTVPGAIVYAELLNVTSTNASLTLPSIDLGNGEKQPTFMFNYSASPGIDTLSCMVMDCSPYPLLHPENCGAFFYITIPSTTSTLIVFNSGGSFMPDQLLCYYGSGWEDISYLATFFTGGVIFNTSELYGRSSYQDAFVINQGSDMLPVTLSSFTAVQTSENYAQVTWTTASETDMNGYYIFRADTPNIIEAQRVSEIIAAQNSPEGATYNFVDEEVEIDHEYSYWLQTLGLDGTARFYGPVNITLSIPESDDTPELTVVPGLHGCYPNPFNPATTVSYTLADDSMVSLKVYNLRGEMVRVLEQGSRPAGDHRVVWDGRDESGRPVASGVYLLSLSTGTDIYTAKTILLK